MKSRVTVIVVGGLCCDALHKCGNEYIRELVNTSVSNVCAKTVEEGDTRWAHTALMYSVAEQNPSKITKEDGLFDVLYAAGKKCAAFIGGEEFENVSTDSAAHCEFFKGEKSDERASDALISYIKEETPDFTLLYISQSDLAGHKFGFMSEEYLKVVSAAFDCIKKIREELPLQKIIILSDHGGHDKIHDTRLDSDITIPIILSRICGVNDGIESATILDIAPTATKILGVKYPEIWKGKSLV